MSDTTRRTVREILTSISDVMDGTNGQLGLIELRLSNLLGEAFRALDDAAIAPTSTESLQVRVKPWLFECFGVIIAGNRQERNHRFLEEALELVQSCGCDRSEAHQLVDYVFDRSVGSKTQEVGGVMITLAALCLAQDMDMHECGEVELARIWTKIEQIRAKQAAKPQHSPFPAPLVSTDGWVHRPEAGWTDATLPGGGENVLARVPALRADITQSGYMSNGHFRTGSSTWPIERVIAWMPVPRYVDPPAPLNDVVEPIQPLPSVSAIHPSE